MGFCSVVSPTQYRSRVSSSTPRRFRGCLRIFLCAGAVTAHDASMLRRIVKVRVENHRKLPGRKAAYSAPTSVYSFVYQTLGSKQTITESDIPNILSTFSNVTKDDLDVHEEKYTDGSTSSLFGRPPITYLHIAERFNYSLGVFVLPPNTSIPLHDHPGTSLQPLTHTSRKLSRHVPHLTCKDFLTPITTTAHTPHIFRRYDGLHQSSMGGA